MVNYERNESHLREVSTISLGVLGMEESSSPGLSEVDRKMKKLGRDPSLFSCDGQRGIIETISSEKIGANICSKETHPDFRTIHICNRDVAPSFICEQYPRNLICVT